MSSRKLVDDFKIRYEENNDRLREWDERLLDDELDPLDWIQLMSERSYVTREILSENEDLLNELWEWIPDPLGDFEAELLYDMVMGMFFDECHDFAIMTRIGERLLPYFEEVKVYECLVSLYHMLGSEYSLFYRVSHDRKGLETALSYFRKAVALRDHYDEISMLDVRHFFFQDYTNLISFLDDIHPEQCKEILDLYEEMRRFQNSPQVQEVDGSDAEILHITATADEKLLSMVDEAQDMAPWNRDRLFEMTDKLYYRLGRTELGADDLRARIFYTSQWMQDKLATESFLEKLIAYIDALPLPDYEAQDDQAVLRLIMNYLSYSHTIFHVLGKEDEKLSEMERIGFVQRFIGKVMDIMTSVPYLFQTEMMNTLCMEWYDMAEPYLRREEEKVAFLQRMLIRRQPINEIHSIMVSRIARRIAEVILEKEPELFIGVRDWDSLQDVELNRESLLHFVEAAGRLHDVGKCYIMEIVDKQSRRLFDSEYEMIRRHPRLGRELIGRDYVLAPYFDIVEGHHKYYDGKHGYPVDFNNTTSPERIIIDLISIADSIDAGTDNLGRNYASGKDYDHLLEELKEGAGSRYNPDIVRLMSASEELHAELSELTDQGRYNVCYEAYMDIVKGGRTTESA
ncbi:MAG: HD domain-containing protein [Butyrivibrio sp.]|nr:HD domain-containing protein [Butyrivibrio sp.]